MLEIFKVALRLRDRQLESQSLEISNIFITLTLKQIFLKMKTFFKNLKYPFLVGSTKIEHTTFPYKPPLSVAIVKTNRMRSTK